LLIVTDPAAKLQLRIMKYYRDLCLQPLREKRAAMVEGPVTTQAGALANAD
jgi:hypothetical protein